MWYRKEYDTPTRSDLYVAYVACEVIRGRVKHPSSVRFSDVLKVMQFNPKDDAGGTQLTDPETVTRVSKSNWLAFMGSASHLEVVHKTVAPGEKPYAPLPTGKKTPRWNDPGPS